MAVGISARSICGSSNNSAQSGTEIFIYKGNRLPTTAELAAHPNGEYRQATRQTASGQVQEIILGEHFDISRKRLVETALLIGLIIHGQTLLGSWFFGAVVRITVRIAASLMRTRITIGRPRMRLSALALRILGI